MATDSGSQRAYRAACPNCGAPVEFRSAASAFAVCSYCRSSIVRDGEALRRIGQSAELFDDHSALQLGTSGRLQGEAFTLVGRLQLRTADGTWNEWHALFDNGRSGWLSEDNGRYVVAFDAPVPAGLPPAATLRASAALRLDDQYWTVASVVRATLGAAQGELPRPPALGREFTVAELRSPRNEVGTLDDADPAAPAWSIGRPVALEALALVGLAQPGEKTLGGRSLACPSCGNAIEIKLDSTKSIACNACHAVVDVSQGIGGDLAHYAQDNGSEPQIPLGTIGRFAFDGAVRPWQVVGYAERCEVAQGPEDAQSFWREYLLYHRESGFAFLVDAQDGWSWTMPLTGAPEGGGEGSVRWQGEVYRKLYTYTGQVTYVLGEFYWRLERGQRTDNTDYLGIGSAARKRLNREQAGEEVVWSGGETLEAQAVLQAFQLAPDRAAALARDAGPTAARPAANLARGLIWLAIIVVVLILFECSESGGNDCDSVLATYGQSSAEYQNCLRSNRSGGGLRSSGGSFGGFSSGGSHK